MTHAHGRVIGSGCALIVYYVLGVTYQACAQQTYSSQIQSTWAHLRGITKLFTIGKYVLK